MRINNVKLKQILLIISILVIEILITNYIKLNETIIGKEKSLIIVSWLCNISIIVMILSWKRLTKEIVCPYIIFLLVLFLFSCGQAIGWSFGLDMGDKNMWNRVDHGINKTVLLSGLSYSIIGITSFHLGALCSFSPKKNSDSRWDVDSVTQSYKFLGKSIMIIALPSFFLQALSDIIAVISGGYANFYIVNDNAGFLMNLVNILADWYLPCLLILLIAYRNNKKYRNLVVLGMIFQVVVSLFVGGRSTAVMTTLGIILVYHYFVKKLDKKRIVMAIFFGYIGIAGLNAIAVFRNISNRSINDLINLTFNSFGNAIGEMLGELGWSITSICWTMELVPTVYPFRYGMSYLVSLICWIPSVFFGGKSNHPVVVWGHLADWLQGALHMSYGPGFTMIAEAYINFGYFGYIALAIEGFIITKIIARILRCDVEKNLVGATFQILVILTIMKSLVRSSLSVAFRSVMFILIPLYILIYINTKKKVRH